MWNFIKLVFSAIVEACVTATVFAIATILVLWGANGFPSAEPADFVGLLGWFGVIGTAVATVAKIVEFGWLLRAFDKHGRAFDRAYDNFYTALSHRDYTDSRFWLERLAKHQVAVYGDLSHISKWRGVNNAVIKSQQLETCDRVRIARNNFDSVGHRDWR